MLDKPPDRPVGDDKVAEWLQWVHDNLTQLPFIANSDDIKVDRVAGKLVLQLKSRAPGQVVVMKACLADGTECYVPVVVCGKIYRTAAGTYKTPTITESDVPNNMLLLE